MRGESQLNQRPGEVVVAKLGTVRPQFPVHRAYLERVLAFFVVAQISDLLQPYLVDRDAAGVHDHVDAWIGEAEARLPASEPCRVCRLDAPLRLRPVPVAVPLLARIPH